MSFEETIERLFKRFLARFVKPVSFEAEVLSVDASKDTCKVKPVEGAEIDDVRLRSVINDSSEDKVVIYPKVGSFVMVSRIFNLDEFYVSKVDEVENIKIKCSGITINDGEKGGLINIADLVTKVNNMENKTNEILQILQTITIPLAPSGTYPFNTNFVSVQPLTETQQADIEDTKVTH